MSTKLATETLTSVVRSLQNDSLELQEHLWTGLSRLMRASWTTLLSDDLLRNFYLSLYNDASDTTRRPAETQPVNRGKLIHYAARENCFETEIDQSHSQDWNLLKRNSNKTLTAQNIAVPASVLIFWHLQFIYFSLYVISNRFYGNFIRLCLYKAQIPL